jgi:hypothetical protein
MQTIKLLELHKIQEVAFGDSSWNPSPRKHKAQTQQKNHAKKSCKIIF